ncbi:MAG: hypothetical protein Q4C42_11065, partial [Clostridia bacterium]|nr:hypothetical protein [Clostridia bacterium]
WIKVSKPSAKTGLVYNGKTQIGVPSGTGYTITGNKATNAGTYTAKVTLKDGFKWSDGSTSKTRSITWTIAKKKPTVKAPTAKTIVYNGYARTLINAGSTSNGTMKYSLSQSGTYSTTIPKKTNVGVYKVWYKVVGTTNYAGTSPKYVIVKIRPQKAVISGWGNTSEGLKIKWNKVSSASGYQIFRGTTLIKTISGNSTFSYVDTDTKNYGSGSAVTYYVRAYYKNSIGTAYGPKSNARRTYRVKAPLSVSATAGNGYIRLSYTEMSNVAGYDIYRSTSRTGTYSKVKSVTGTSYKNTGLTKGKTYYYKIKSYIRTSDNKYTSAYSSVVYATVK